MPLSKINKRLRGIFFGKTDVEKAEEMLQLYIKHIPKLRKIMNEGYEMGSDEEIEKSMYDFYETFNGEVNDNIREWEQTFTVNASGKMVENDLRKPATPVSVLKELETVPTPFSVNADDIDDKIDLLNHKKNLVSQRFTQDQVKGLIQRLKNRKHYKNYYGFYEKFPNTNDEKIDNLLAKYKLVMKKSDLFVPTFPKEAIDIMREYAEVTQKITREKCVFYVIAEAKDFKKKERKLDPILLVQSPFGFYWNVLGAWDKECLILHEL